jgi:drug/metabolite transporter (DMT)-like permease
MAADGLRGRLAAAAPLVFVLLWSTGFIGARFGLPWIEPFTFLTVRFLLVLVLLGLLKVVLRQPWPTAPAGAAHSAVVGLLLHGGYLGGVFFAIDRGMPAGLTSLIVSLQPILTALIARRALGEQVSRRQWIGLTAGLGGVALVVSEKLVINGAAYFTPATVAAVLIALFSTTGGTLYQKRFGGGIPLLGGTWLQYLAAFGLLGALALLFETRTIVWHVELLFALAWLVLMLSIGAILILMLLIRSRSAARVSSLFYLVPPATALEAWLLFGERFGVLSLLGLITASIGVALVVLEPPPRAAE